MEGVGKEGGGGKGRAALFSSPVYVQLADLFSCFSPTVEPRCADIFHFLAEKETSACRLQSNMMSFKYLPGICPFNIMYAVIFI